MHHILQNFKPEITERKICSTIFLRHFIYFLVTLTETTCFVNILSVTKGINCEVLCVSFIYLYHGRNIFILCTTSSDLVLERISTFSKATRFSRVWKVCLDTTTKCYTFSHTKRHKEKRIQFPSILYLQEQTAPHFLYIHLFELWKQFFFNQRSRQLRIVLPQTNMYIYIMQWGVWCKNC